MSDFRFFSTHRTWEDWCGMLLGVLIVLSPWFPTQASHEVVDAERSVVILNTFTVAANFFPVVADHKLPRMALATPEYLPHVFR